MKFNGDLFIVLNTSNDNLVIGRNAEDADEICAEILYYAETEALEGDPNGGVKAELTGDKRMILQKPKPGMWGADYGANENGVVAAISWSSGEEANSGGLMSTDMLRCALSTSTTAVDAVECCGKLIEAHGVDNSKFNLVVCDSSSAWTISCASKWWAAQQLLTKEPYKYIPSVGLCVTTAIDRSSSDLDGALKSAGIWNGEGELNFAACFGAHEELSTVWCGPLPSEDGSYSLTDMFTTLRSAASESSRAANVSVLKKDGISCHWFTGTPNANESVFKPFLFAPSPKISPLTKVPKEGGDNSLSEVTLLHKLHAQRKSGAVDDLKALEAECVKELNAYLSSHSEVDAEVDELLKDCVEAEVKFYR